MSTRRKPSRGNPAGGKRAPRVAILPDGSTYLVADDRHHQPPPTEPVDGVHEWVVVSVYRVDPTRSTQTLDDGNLATIEGPACLHCEQHYSRALAAQPCPGERREGAA